MKISIVMPAYNEEKRIGSTLEAYTAYFEALRKQKKLDYEIIVVINNTTDRTLEIVKKCQKINPRLRYLDLVKGGKGYAVLEGFRDALTRENNELMGFVDADGATSPEAYYSLIRAIGGFDGAIASRYIKGAKVSPAPKLRRIIVSRIYNLFIRALFLVSYRDTQCGAKVFRAEIVKKLIPKISMSKWAFDLDLIYNTRKLGGTIIETPTVWGDKNYSKINLVRTGPWMVLGVVRLRLINSPLSFLVGFYDKLVKFFLIK